MWQHFETVNLLFLKAPWIVLMKYFHQPECFTNRNAYPPPPLFIYVQILHPLDLGRRISNELPISKW